MVAPVTPAHSSRRYRRQLHGLNYTFPYPSIDWTPESGYPPSAPANATPWRVFGAGKGLGLSVVLDAELFDYYCSSTASVGFKVLMHSPIETPRLSEFAYFITPGDEARVEITPKISTTTPDLVNIPEVGVRATLTESSASTTSLISRVREGASSPARGICAFIGLTPNETASWNVKAISRCRNANVYPSTYQVCHQLV